MPIDSPETIQNHNLRQARRMSNVKTIKKPHETIGKSKAICIFRAAAILTLQR
jgi:hypothetical protein